MGKPVLPTVADSYDCGGYFRSYWWLSEAATGLGVDVLRARATIGARKAVALERNSNPLLI
jgi:hypothetical protein